MLASDVGLIVAFYCSVVILFSYVHASEVQLDSHKTVSTEYGLVRGRLEMTYLNQKPYYAFKGIPYASPPIGELRFKAPEPPESWWESGVKDAFEYGAPCMLAPTNYEIPGPLDENCLFMNVYVPATNSTAKMASIVHIVGGAFITNPSDDSITGPDFLIEHDVILVTFNYRLEIFGFMSLDTPEYSGNMGLKDQLMAIQFVNRNIEHFGGDNTQVTLMGHSAGSVSAGYQILNEESRKNYQRAILMSGSVLNYNAYHDGDHKCLMYAIARNASRPANNIDELIEFMKTTPATQIQDFINDIYYQLPWPLPWNPVIERPDAVRPFIVKPPAQIAHEIRELNLSSLITFTDRETLYFENAQTLQPDVINSRMEHNQFELPIHGYNVSYGEKPYLQSLLRKSKHYFLRNATTDSEIADRYVAMKSYMLLGHSFDKLVKFHIEKSKKPTYYLRFSVQATMRGFKAPYADEELPVKGASHVEDLCYVFKCNAYHYDYDYINATKDTNPESVVSLQTIKNMTTLFTNFVKFGDPSFGGDIVDEFIPAKSNEMNFLDVTKNGLISGRSPNGHDELFMDYVVEEGTQLIRENDTPAMPQFDVICLRHLNKTR